MRLLAKGLIIIGLLMAGAYAAFAEEKNICVKFNGVEYCETTTVIKIGEKEVPVDDPLSLLNSIGNAQVEKISLWDVYKYPPVISELARQLKVTEDMLIYELKDADASWMALYELTQIYDKTSKELRGQHVDAATLDKLFQLILDDIIANIKDQLKAYNGVEV